MQFIQNLSGVKKPIIIKGKITHVISENSVKQLNHKPNYKSNLDNKCFTWAKENSHGIKSNTWLDVFIVKLDLISSTFKLLDT